MSSVVDSPSAGLAAGTDPDVARDVAAWLSKLNDAQRAAVEHGSDRAAGAAGLPGPLLVIAGAGSGKTSTLAHRVAHLVLNGADPHRILLLTFSRRAAQEMTRRVARIASGVPRAAAALAHGLTWAGTFHGVGARLLREYADRIGLAPGFTINDREDSADLMNLVRHELGLSAKEKRFPSKSTCLAIYSRVVNTGEPLADVLARAFSWCAEWEPQLRALFAAYVDAKQKQDVLDYDDLLLYWSHMAAEPSLAADLSGRFDHVLVDEYQDTNRLQASILLALKPDGRGLTVVGDDAQAIYSFRGATVRNILDFPAQFDPPARQVTLERNYRSTQPILAASNAVIDAATERFTKNLWSDRASAQRPRLVTVADEAQQARYVVEQVLEAREAGMKLKNQAVLFRAAHHSAALEIELARRNIPYVKFGGLRFLDAVHVKDVLAVLRWAENPLDRVAGFRVAQLLPGVGPANAARLLDQVAACSGAYRTADALAAFAPPPRAAEDWPAFVALMDAVCGRRTPWPGEFERVRRWYEPHLERNHEDAAARHADLVQMESIACTYPSRERFLTELTLDPPDATSDESGVPLLDEDYLILSTIHSAKGQEWRNVFVLNGVDGCIPSDLGTGSDDEIDEERRLLYVAMTRAKEELHIVVPQRFYVYNQTASGDRHVWASRTRFIPAPILPLFESRAWPPAPVVAAPTAAGLAAAAQAKIEIGAKLRKMWD
ncbi:DNA helicase-2 / ATP-dependent DNA helicase PcrA [Paraburkholderia caballeronis]|uniref:DNA 3'-5' helicase n=1 Tax=Paraburkholderia caballeronis TaxID=416943 RepID=A0A1H7MI11_9BURK|nr:DNA helicase-2/ATP-dependent DNA helicase PcrA [Paraburkholderia caballeronis]PXX02125.1 DNA helicase-2/ATP-dependent DNA helicase PcrA [Paraburkholderia caballeronis]RAK01282.1 DNA helicase-2/ATP-dependent DNA helicase PcrA [Paraburkholderia caballeronis]SEB87455.1 DNA helicase-2 / ATP-dependent DNA helicase PcrA [Paraburkholderia caballeronis]SEL10822.1 DNA helicase-2 / ATP-dependent DNA helicase PcrA [Paraburkholderia caballeronis]